MQVGLFEVFTIFGVHKIEVHIPGDDCRLYRHILLCPRRKPHQLHSPGVHIHGYIRSYRSISVEGYSA
ncbi:hypothetical protein ABKN59_011830 [Abortiporus biennis]